MSKLIEDKIRNGVFRFWCWSCKVWFGPKEGLNLPEQLCAGCKPRWGMVSGNEA